MIMDKSNRATLIYEDVIHGCIIVCNLSKLLRLKNMHIWLYSKCKSIEAQIKKITWSCFTF